MLDAAKNCGSPIEEPAGMTRDWTYADDGTQENAEATWVKSVLIWPNTIFQ